ncbi:Hsp20/alpha crystallin family protein [Streptomyces gardneri]|uniref:Alpha-crystallin n=1 Tax=Streptomyces gardneri TaxID=66892 RepID=A0A4Y3RKJ3_9ACTN|nr:Hsp20/alpha crystallin family protein [Streptomyces gardneri]GEB57448.1 alpha-crystallin [Streptomyces gardneri]GHH23828.1 14 kDa antigen [Streptomyces gardneri]
MSTGMERRRSFFPEFPDVRDWFGDLPRFPMWRTAFERHVIPIEVTSGEGRYVLKAELPGVDPDEDITITVDGDVLTVSAEHEESSETKDHSEFRYGSFERAVRLPEVIDPEDVKAEYADGVLTVSVAVRQPQESRARTVPVTRAGGADEAESAT